MIFYFFSYYINQIITVSIGCIRLQRWKTCEIVFAFILANEKTSPSHHWIYLINWILTWMKYQWILIFMVIIRYEWSDIDEIWIGAAMHTWILLKYSDIRCAILKRLKIIKKRKKRNVAGMGCCGIVSTCFCSNERFSFLIRKLIKSRRAEPSTRSTSFCVITKSINENPLIVFVFRLTRAPNRLTSSRQLYRSHMKLTTRVNSNFAISSTEVH